MNNTEHFYLVKGDISGIQEFIFNIQSKNAAKALKARSFFIEAISLLAEKRIESRFGSITRVFNGGGNFYLEISEGDWNEDIFNKLQKEFLSPFLMINLSISLSYIEVDGNCEFGEIIQELNNLSNKTKYTKYGTTAELNYFEPFVRNDIGLQNQFKELTNNIVNSSHFQINEVQNQPEFPDNISKNSITFFYQKLQLSKIGEKIYSNLPVWNEKLLTKYNKLIEETINTDFEEVLLPQKGALIEFGYLADFAKERTGTSKLGVLKLDVDNLSSVFREIKNESDIKYLSKQLSSFFSIQLTSFLSQKFKYLIRDGDNKSKTPLIFSQNGRRIEIVPFMVKEGSDYYKNNLYIVFAGGDDCFIIGGWDAVIEFTIFLKEKFDQFEQSIRKKLVKLKHPITFSASVTIVDNHYPVVKFAELAEGNLSDAKSFNLNPKIIDASGKPMKNKISFLGEVFTWEEFGKVIELKDQFQKMIKQFGENRSFLHHIQNSFVNADSIYWQKLNKPFNPALLWRFLYQFRDIKNKKYFKLIFQSYFFGDLNDNQIGGIYKTEIYDAFSDDNKQSLKLPIAARWAEFLTRH